MGLLRKIGHTCHELALSNDSPEAIARGAALGVFLGIFPTFGLGTVLSVGLASLLRWNCLAAAAGSLIMNPATFAFFWGLSVLVGTRLMAQDTRQLLDVVQSLPGGWDFIGAFISRPEWSKDLLTGAGIYLTGNGLVSLTWALASYIVIKKVAERYKRNR